MKTTQYLAVLIIPLVAAFSMPSAQADTETHLVPLAFQKPATQLQQDHKGTTIFLQGFGSTIAHPIPKSDVARAVRLQTVHDFQAALDAGEEALKRGNSAAAIADIQLAQKIEPFDGLAKVRLAEAYAANKQPEQAIATYRSLIYRGPGRDWSNCNHVGPRIFMNYSLLLQQTGQFLEALIIYNCAQRFLNDETSVEVKVPQLGPNGLPNTPQLLQAMTCLGIGIDTPGYDGDRLIEAVKLIPDSAAANFYLGKYLYGRNEAGSDVYLRKAVELGDSLTKDAANKYLRLFGGK